MTEQVRTAYVTGAASGIGQAVAEMLVKKGIKVFLADQNTQGVESVAKQLNQLNQQQQQQQQMAFSTTLNATSWPSQLQAFTQAVHQFNNHIDLVYPIAGIGERRWLPPFPPQTSQTQQQNSIPDFEKPDLTVLDVDLTGFLYTISLSIQQFRHQPISSHSGLRGEIACVTSVCGFYCVPTLPVYTAAKHGVTGFIRSYGKYLLSHEHISINAVAPNVVRTGISTEGFYGELEGRGLLTPIQGVVGGFEMLVDGNDGYKGVSGEVWEVGPNFGKSVKDGVQGAVIRKPAEYLDEESEVLVGLLEQRGLGLQIAPQ